MTKDTSHSDGEPKPDETEEWEALSLSGWDAQSMVDSRLAPPVNAAAVADILSQSSEAEVPQKNTADPDLDGTHDSDTG